MAARTTSSSIASPGLDPLSKPFSSPFRTDNDSFSAASEPRPLLELAMARMSAAIRSKPDWRNKRRDPRINWKWRQEAASLDPLLTSAALQYVMDELDYYDALLDLHTGIEMSTVDGVWQSDSLLPAELTADIQRTVTQCWGHETSEQRDWHPGSGQQVWDIVHPSLYCLVAGRTRVVEKDVSVEGSLGAMCSGRVLGAAQYGRAVEQQMAAMRVKGDRWGHIFAREPDSDADEAATQPQDEAEQSAEEKAVQDEAAWQEGKMALSVWVPAPIAGQRLHKRKLAVYVKPDARLVDVKAQVAPHVPKSWTEAEWWLMWGSRSPTLEEDVQPLFILDIHSGTDLAALRDEEIEKRAKARAETEKKAKAALKPIRIEVTTPHGVCISVHRLDESAKVDTLLQHLRDGAGEARKSRYPAFARGVPVAEQRLYKQHRSVKRLLPHHTFAHYRLHNGNKVTLAWHRITAAESVAEAPTVELQVQPLVSTKLPAILLDVTANDQLWWVRHKLCGMLPKYDVWRRLPSAQCHVYFPSTSDMELSDDSITMSALGVDGQQSEARLGVRWDGDEAVAAEAAKEAAEEKAKKEAMEVELQPADDNEQSVADQSSQHDNPNPIDTELPQPQSSIVESKANEPVAKEEEKAKEEDRVELTVVMAGQSLKLAVTFSTTVREVKERLSGGQVDESKAEAVQLAAGVPVARLQLTMDRHDKVMNDNRTLAFYGLGLSAQGRQHLKCEIKEETETATDSGDAPHSIELSLLELYGGAARVDSRKPQGTRDAIDCPADQTIGELRRRIHQRMEPGHSVEEVRMRRAVGEPALSDERTLTEAGFRDSDTAVVDLCTTTVCVTLVLPSAAAITTFTLSADGTTTIRELKQRIAARRDGYPVEWQWVDLVIQARPHNKVVTSVDDDKLMSSYGLGKEKDERMHMLVCRRQHARPTQSTEQEAAEQPEQLLGLLVSVTTTNDIRVLGVLSWQPLLAVKWQLAWMKVASFDEQRLSMYPPSTSLSNVISRSAASQLHPLSDDFASLQSLGVGGGRILQLDRSEVPLFVHLPHDTERHQRPLQEDDDCIMHAQLDDTVAQLKSKLQTLANLPASRFLFRFHRLLPVQVEDTMTLRQLGFTARGKTEKYAQHSWLDGYQNQNELTVCLLSGSATQLLPVGVRCLAIGSRASCVLLLSDESIGEVRVYLWQLLESAIQPLNVQQHWSEDNIVLTVGGRTVDSESAVSALLESSSEDQLPVIDVLVKPDEIPVTPDEEDGEDDDERNEAAMEDDEESEHTDDDGDEKDDGDGDGIMNEGGDALAQADVHMEDEQAASGTAIDNVSDTDVSLDKAKSRHPQLEQAHESNSPTQPAQRVEAATASSAANEDRDDGQRFCLHPQHRLRLMRPYISKDNEVLEERYCDVCSREQEFTPDGQCWHCEKCRYDVCQQCFSRAQPSVDDVQPHLSSVSAMSADVKQPQTEGDDGGEDDESDAAAAASNHYHTSAKYAWLPTDFHVGDDGTVRCLSYINNLHPVQHAAVYPLIERVVTRFIPLFERVLTSLRHPPQDKAPVSGWYDPADEERHDKERAAKQRKQGADFDEDDDDQSWWESKPIHQPLVPPFTMPTPLPDVVSLRGRRLQLIVKLADIVLTPEQSHYAGGAWHVEGMRNECIVASGIAYYDQSNIGPSSLAFRCAVTEPLYEQNDSRGVKAVYGLQDEKALVQPLGAIDTCKGRCIAFPNVFQHRVAPFSLLDATKPGHRSILVLFLVDPTINLISTSRVPPQQREWMAESTQASAVTDALGGVRVLSELVDSYLDWPMARAEAEQHRAALMYERKYFVKENTATVFERPFSLCEH